MNLDYAQTRATIRRIARRMGAARATTFRVTERKDGDYTVFSFAGAIAARFGGAFQVVFSDWLDPYADQCIPSPKNLDYGQARATVDRLSITAGAGRAKTYSIREIRSRDKITFLFDDDIAAVFNKPAGVIHFSALVEGYVARCLPSAPSLRDYTCEWIHR